jgi:hypothetical protein
MSNECSDVFPSVQIPDFDGFVETPTDKSLTIWADGEDEL